MKNKIYSIVISMLLFVASLVVVLSIYYRSDFFSKSLVLNIGYSILGGSLLSTAIGIIDYFSLKKKTINSFYDECFEFVKTLNKIEFTYIGDKELIIAEYLYVKDFLNNDNENKEKFIKRAADAFNKQRWNVTPANVLYFIDAESKTFETNLNKSMFSYINLSNYLTDRLIDISNDIYFFCPLMRWKHKENNELCKMAIEIINYVATPSRHFSSYLNKETSNIFAVTKFLQDINNFIFKIKVLENGIVAWKEKMNNFNEQLNKFICSVNRKKYIKKEYEPFFETFSMSGPN